MNKDSIRIDYRMVKRFLHKNNYVLVFSLLAFFFLLVSIFVKLNIGLGGLINTSLFELFFTFNSWLWFFLSMMFVLSAIAAYYEKYSIMFMPILVWLLFTSSFLRTQNISGLKDVTTGDWTLGPDLDPFLFLRNAIEISKGELDPVDHMRYAPLWKPNSYVYANIMPWSIYYLYKFLGLFMDTSLTYAAIIAPVIFFALSSLFFFLFVSNLFSFNLSKIKSQLIGIVATTFYIFSAPMLHRTVAGIPELESLGMVWFWLAFLFFTLAWKQERARKMITYGILAGIFTGGMIWTWGGYRYIFMAISLSSFIFLLFNKSLKKNFIIYSSWIIPSIILALAKSNNWTNLLFDFNNTGLGLAVFFVIIMDRLVYGTKIKDYLKLDRINLPKSVKSILLAILLGIIFLLIVKPSYLLSLIPQIIEGFLYPFGRGRIGLTVAENRAPYFVEVFSSFGYIFWAFFFGAIVLFYEATKNFDFKKKLMLNLFFVIFITSFIFSRISSGHLLNGDNFISKLLYLGGLIVFILVLLFTYVKAHKERDSKTLEDFRKISYSYVLVLSLSFFTMISMRGAIRLFFIVAPILIIVCAYFVVKFSDYTLNIKDSTTKLIVGVIGIVFLLLLLNTFASQATSTVQSAKATVPGAYYQQWQYAMAWVRDNTPEGSIFTHWWDYGYWVQTLGERPSVSDGGHYITFWDHTVGRYLLTTPYPETALSLLKTHQVSYLLIDSTDLGKYSAYSSIGSDDTNDRFSSIPTILLDSSQTVETSDGYIMVYSGGIFVDEDINYNDNGTQIFIPGNTGNSYIGGIIWTIRNGKDGKDTSFERPIGVYVFNGQQYRIPIRYAFIEGRLLDFGGGIEAVVRALPTLESNSINPIGSVLYLSPKVAKGLFAQLYLLDDAFGNYGTLELVHSEDDPVVKSIRSQGFDSGDFIYYQGFRGPIRIWKVGIPDNIIEREEFLKTDGEYGELDNLKFTK